jgi:hypothetical protein
VVHSLLSSRLDHRAPRGSHAVGWIQYLRKSPDGEPPLLTYRKWIRNVATTRTITC